MVLKITREDGQHSQGDESTARAPQRLATQQRLDLFQLHEFVLRSANPL
jgi:hypothetical protein